MLALRTLALLPLLAAPGLAQCGEDILTAFDGAFGDSFGFAVDLEDDLLVVGSPRYTGFTGSGIVYVYQRSGSDWILLQQLEPNDPSPAKRFGNDVAISFPWMIIGAPGNAENRGAAYLFRNVQGTWEQRKKLVRDPNAPGEEFGRIVDIDGTTAAVGSFWADGVGGAYAYRHTASGWSPPYELTPTLPATYYGRAIDVDQDRIAVGDISGEGRVLLFGWDGVDFTQEEEFLLPPGTIGSGLGYSLALEGSTLLASCYSVGGAHAYREDAQGWSWEHRLVPPGSQTGLRVALSGDLAVVGSPLDALSDRAYFHERRSGAWEYLREYEVPGLGPGDLFGDSLVLDGETSVVTNHAHNQQHGAVYISDGTQRVVPYCFCDVASAPCNNMNTEAGCTNSTGGGAYFEACGSTSVTGDVLTLRASGLPAQQFGLIYMGGEALDLPFGAGERCVGNGGIGLFRFAVQSSGASGNLTLGPGIAAESALRFGSAGTIGAGSTWFFQAWYRDPAGPCSGFNLSNGLQITFQP